ncbi:MAG: flavin oxidoreductase/NADH oxidase [Clostridia bacterium]|nr:flavin oxidoreductase/NADH oxidase [Clostridia bacterium]
MNRRVYTKIEDFEQQNATLECPLPYTADTSALAAPLSLGKKTAPNRLVCQAMEGCDGRGDGAPDELTRRRYRRFAAGGAGVIWFEATACCEEGRANPRQLWLTEKNLDVFRETVEEIREIGLRENGYAPLILMQDTHSGRYSKPQGTPAPVIAYNNPLFEKDNPIDASRIITDEGIDRVKEDLIATARLAEKAGFDGVDIKCCHRYLNSELLSAYERKGRYGGSFENRTRLLRESVEGAIQSCGSDFLVSSRLNVYDGFPYPYGFGVRNDGSLAFDPTEPIRLLRELSALGVELLNITMGNPYVNPHVNRPFAQGGYTAEEHPLEGVARMLHGTATLKAAVPEIRLICSGLSYLGVAAPGVAAGFVEKDGFDLAGFGRTIFAHPNFAKEILGAGELKKERLCLCCSKCTELMRNGSTPGCVLRDELYTDLYKSVLKN